MDQNTTQTSGQSSMQWPGAPNPAPTGAADSPSAPHAADETATWKARAQTAQGMHRAEKARADALAVENMGLQQQIRDLRAAQPLQLTPEQREIVDDNTLGVIRSVAEQIVQNTMPLPPATPPAQPAPANEDAFYSAIKRAVPQALNVFDKPEFLSWLHSSGNYAVLDSAERNFDAPAAIGVFVRYLEASATPQPANQMPALPSVAAQSAAPSLQPSATPATYGRMSESQYTAGLDRLTRMDSRAPEYGALRGELAAARQAGLLPG